MLFDIKYWLVIGAGLALSLWAQYKVKSTFSRFSRFSTRRGMRGAEVARAILRQAGIHDVEVEPVAGTLTDHYDPRERVLRLSEPVYHSDSMSAVGVAAHEVGHAIQHAEKYSMLEFRSAWVPLANLGGGLSMIVLIAAMFLGGLGTALGSMAAVVGVVLFALTTIFTLITLPVEFDASKRALVALEAGGFTTSEEHAGAKKVLDAAALTYVAAFVTSLLTLLYWLSHLGFFGGRND